MTTLTQNTSNWLKIKMQSKILTVLLAAILSTQEVAARSWWDIGHLAGHGARASPQARESLDVAIRMLKSTFSNNRAEMPVK